MERLKHHAEQQQSGTDKEADAARQRAMRELALVSTLLEEDEHRERAEGRREQAEDEHVRVVRHEVMERVHEREREQHAKRARKELERKVISHGVG